MSHALSQHNSDRWTSSGYQPPGLLLLLYYLFAAMLAITLILLSENIYFRDYGDFARAIGFMLTGVRDEPHLLWVFREEGIGRIHGLDISASLFKLMGTVQHWYADYYSLQVNSIFAKLALVLYADVLARLVSRHFRRPTLSRAIAFTAICLAFFAAHNIGIAQSFYAEYAFFIFFPLLLIGFFCGSTNAGKLLIVAGALLCGLAKVQYFYIPTLALLCIWVLNRVGQHRTPRWLLVTLCLAQVICVVPLARNPHAELNHHQATYFGSYLVLSEAELRSLDLNDEQIACVGIDGWGHKAKGPGGTQPEYVGSTCYGRDSKSTLDVLVPYLRYPATLLKLMLFSLPYHFTTHYTHVYAHFPYVTPRNGKDFKGGILLVKLSELREKTVTRLAVVLVILGLVVPFLRRPGQHRGLGLSSLFLALFIISQIVVSLLGEGIRDLSKHLWAAQLALDFLVLALLAQSILWFTRARHARHAS